MGKILRFSMAQINCTVGDFEGNYKKISENIQRAKALGSDMVIFPELAVTGYPPEDLLLKEKFVDDNMALVKKIASAVNDIVVILGYVDKKGKDIFNAAAVIYRGEIKGVYHKVLLPNYGVFDEKRYFERGNESGVFKYGELIFGVGICEDIWRIDGPTKSQAASGAKFVININASPYHAGKIKEREEIVKRQAKDNSLIIIYTNMAGGQDELVFDGQSMVVDKTGKVIYRAEAFREDLYTVDLDVPESKVKNIKDMITVSDKIPVKPRQELPKIETKALGPAEEIYQALVLGLRDYVSKNGFKTVVMGLSGGIDSSLVASIAVDALGKDNVTGVFMPSRYSSRESEKDAKDTSANLGIRHISISIEHIFKMYLMTLEPHFAGRERGIAEENVQARIRGNILMALSNKFGWLVLTTGNKSEMSTGYATLYGDMAGGFAVIKDVYKTVVYKLAKYRNSISAVIPDNVITKEPSAELKPDQKDSDSLPPYGTLDPILKSYIEDDRGMADIVSKGFDRDVVARVLNMVDKNEYKRRQSPPGIKITPKAFGRDRRMPITNRYR